MNVDFQNTKSLLTIIKKAAKFDADSLMIL